MMTVARMRADAEDQYGHRLGDIEYATNRIDGGFQRDDGASVKKVCKWLTTWEDRGLTPVGLRRGPL